MRSYFMVLSGNPLTQMAGQCALQHVLTTPDFMHDIHTYETYEGAVEMLTYICEVMRIVQSKRIDRSPYIAINGDGSTDLGKQHQFTIDIRTIDPITNETHTEFLQLSNCAATARAMTLAFVRALGTNMKKVIGGGFDGANSMMGAKGGVQALLKEYAPFAEFVHCVCHRAALLSKYAVGDDSNTAIARLHDALAKIYAAFARSSVRLDDLHAFQAEFGEPTLNPKSLAATRWLSSRDAALQAKKIINSLLAKFDSLEQEKSGDEEKQAEVSDLKKYIHSAEFVILLHVHYQMLDVQATLATKFQAKDTFIGEIRLEVNALKTAMAKFANASNGLEVPSPHTAAPLLLTVPTVLRTGA